MFIYQADSARFTSKCIAQIGPLFSASNKTRREQQRQTECKLYAVHTTYSSIPYRNILNNKHFNDVVKFDRFQGTTRKPFIPLTIYFRGTASTQDWRMGPKSFGFQQTHDLLCCPRSFGAPSAGKQVPPRIVWAPLVTFFTKGDRCGRRTRGRTDGRTRDSVGRSPFGRVC